MPRKRDPVYKVPVRAEERGEPLASRDLFRAVPAGFPGPVHRELGAAIAIAVRQRERSLAEGYAWRKFRHDGSPPRRVATTLRIEETTAATTFGAGFGAGWGMPAPLAHWLGALAGRAGWHCRVVRDGESGEPVGCGALCVTEAPRARELGCEAVVAEPGVPGPDGPGPACRNLLRAGVVPTYARPNRVRPAR